MFEIFSIISGLIIILITAIFLIYNSKKKQVVHDKSSALFKNLSKEELLKARLDFYSRSPVLNYKNEKGLEEESTSNSPAMNVRENINNRDLQTLNKEEKNVEKNDEKKQVVYTKSSSSLKNPLKEELSKTSSEFHSRSLVFSNENEESLKEKSSSYSPTNVEENGNNEPHQKLNKKERSVEKNDNNKQQNVDNNLKKLKEFSKKSQQSNEISLRDSAKKSNINEVILKSFSSYSELPLPTIQPIKSIEEMLAWIPGYDDFCRSIAPRKKFSRKGSYAKTLVCHDMKGGYIEDRFIQGFGSDKCYRFQDWNYIDSFCYFSHNLVTIPPPCWTNAAHIHGVKSLGTFITEWQDGARACASIFSDISSVKRFAKILVEIACYYNFDGWLINIENDIIPSQVENLKKFIQILTKHLHDRIPDSEVIWYDSVLSTGQLKWQNKLCSENKVFFDLCDGIFLNYNWSIYDLQHSLFTSGEARKLDVYVGVDVFGRGCFGGGGWNSCKAMQVIREKKLSAAIFAPGWVMENHGEEEFTKNNKKFWELLAAYLYPHFLSELPFVTSFCQGYGAKVFVQGKMLQNKPWTNLSAQSFQPTFSNNLYQLGPKEGMQVDCIEFQTEEAYNGGGCLCIKGLAKPCEEQTRTVLRLFKTDIKLMESTNYSVEFTYKCSSDRVQLFLLVLLEDNPSYIVFNPSKAEIQSCSVSSTYAITNLQDSQYVFQEPLNNQTLTTNAEGIWLTRSYSFVAQKSCCLQEIRVILATGGIVDVDEKLPFKVLLGEIKVCLSNELHRSVSSAKNLQCHNLSSIRYESKQKLCFTLSWNISLSENEIFPKCFDIFCSGNITESNATLDDINFGCFIGRSYNNSYCVNELIVPLVCGTGVIITVQGVSELNTRQNYDECAQVLIKWP
uniref:Cytosolic endo-beta-N-acetylglucosaminidase n=1 Tax=Hydra vulgaris TaxID=6087 RepID=T2M8M3_HYDVU